MTVLVEATTPARREFLVTRRVPDPPVVRDIAGTVLALTPSDVLGPIEIFSQHELAELAEDPRYVAQLLERFAGTTTDAEQNDTLFADLAENRNDILRLDHAINSRQDQLDDLPRLTQQLKQFEDAGVADRAREQRDVGRERGLLDQVDRIVTEAAAVLAPLATAAGAVLAPASDGELPRAAILSQAQELLQELQGTILTARTGIEEGIDRTRGQLATLRATWVEATADVVASYADLATALSAEGLDVASYMTLDAKIQALERQKPELEGLKAARTELYDKRLQLLASYRDNVAQSRQRLGEACTAANEHLRNVVVVKPQRSSDREGLEDLVLQHVSGQKSQIIAALRRDDLSPQAFANACRVGVPALEREYDIRGAQAAALAAAGEALFMAIEEQTIPLAAEAMLNVATTGTLYKSLNELSKGQKATALLLMLLIDATTPLFIDQPEDNLDNRFVFDEIVPRLRQLKGQRQLVMSTHNANVPVLGDADLVVAMECVDNTGCVAEGGVGSLDDEGVRRLTGILLEGGQAAFAARQHLYGY